MAKLEQHTIDTMKRVAAELGIDLKSTPDAIQKLVDHYGICVRADWFDDLFEGPGWYYIAWTMNDENIFTEDMQHYDSYSDALDVGLCEALCFIHLMNIKRQWHDNQGANREGNR